MRKKELRALKDEQFVSKLRLYDFKNIDMLIVEAYKDTYGVDKVPEYDWSDDFIEICEAIHKSEDY